MRQAIYVNGEEQPLEVSTLVELLARAGIDPSARGTAIAVNSAVVPRAAWRTTRLSPGDRIEIVRPYRGG